MNKIIEKFVAMAHTRLVKLERELGEPHDPECPQCLRERIKELNEEK